MDDVAQHMADLTQRLGQGVSQIAEQGRSFQEQVIGMMMRGADPRPPPPPPPAAVRAVRQAIAAEVAVDEAPQAGAKKKAEASDAKAQRALTPAPIETLRTRETIKQRTAREAQERASDRQKAVEVAASKAAKKAMMAAKNAAAEKEKAKSDQAQVDRLGARSSADVSTRETPKERSAREAQEKASASRKAAEEASSKAAKQALVSAKRSEQSSVDKKRASPQGPSVRFELF